MPELDLGALRKAAAAFASALEYALKTESKRRGDLEFFEDEIVRAALIQHFEFTYELCWKTMKRYIEIDNRSSADFLTMRDLFRQAGERGLIDDFAQWIVFHNARNRTSHVYNQEVAQEVYVVAKTFIKPLKNFISVMESRV